MSVPRAGPQPRFLLKNRISVRENADGIAASKRGLPECDIVHNHFGSQGEMIHVDTSHERVCADKGRRDDVMMARSLMCDDKSRMLQVV